jgi:hypothetical protein
VLARSLMSTAHVGKWAETLWHKRRVVKRALEASAQSILDSHCWFGLDSHDHDSEDIAEPGAQTSCLQKAPCWVHSQEESSRQDVCAPSHRDHFYSTDGSLANLEFAGRVECLHASLIGCDQKTNQRAAEHQPGRIHFPAKEQDSANEG